MIIKRCIFDISTGSFVRRFEGSFEQLQGNVFPGEDCIEGSYDMRTMRVAVEQGQPWVVVPVPADPSKPNEDQQIAIDSAMARIREIDARKIRAITDMSITPSPSARQRLTELESEAEACREIIRKNTPKT